MQTAEVNICDLRIGTVIRLLILGKTLIMYESELQLIVFLEKNMQYIGTSFNDIVVKPSTTHLVGSGFISQNRFFPRGSYLKTWWV